MCDKDNIHVNVDDFRIATRIVCNEKHVLIALQITSLTFSLAVLRRFVADATHAKIASQPLLSTRADTDASGRRDDKISTACPIRNMPKQKAAQEIVLGAQMPMMSGSSPALLTGKPFCDEMGGGFVSKLAQLVSRVVLEITITITW